MATWERLTDWTELLAVALATLLVVVVMERSRARQRELRRLRTAFFFSWEAYLEALATGLTRLRKLRALFDGVRPGADQRELSEAVDRLCVSVRAEIAAIEEQAEKMAHARDQQWYGMPMAWSPMPGLDDEIGDLLELAQAGTAPRQADAPRDVGEDLEALREQNATLARRVEELEQKLSELEQAPGRQTKGTLNEEEAAARLMADLADTLTLTEIEAQLATADGELNFCENRLAESPDDPDVQSTMTARMAWMRQVKRWWMHQRKLRNQARLLDEVTGRATEADDERDGEKREEGAEFQAVEAQNAELRKRLAGLSVANRGLTRQLEQLDMEKAEAMELRDALTNVDMARKNAQRELDSLETMVAQMEDDLVQLRVQNTRMEKRVREAEKTESATQEHQQLIAELEQEKTEATTKTEAEAVRLAAAVRALEQQTAAAEEQKDAIEKEIGDLQTSYDELNAQSQQMKSGLALAERNEKQATEKLEEMQRDHKVLQEKQKELRQELAARIKSSGADTTQPDLEAAAADVSDSRGALQKEIVELQQAYDTLNADFMKAKAALGQVERDEAEREDDRQQLKRENAELRERCEQLSNALSQASSSQDATTVAQASAPEEEESEA